MARDVQFACPLCAGNGKTSRVIDVRVGGEASKSGSHPPYLRRRRECANGHRFATVETIAEEPQHGRALLQTPATITEIEKQKLLRAAEILTAAATGRSRKPVAAA